MKFIASFAHICYLYIIYKIYYIISIYYCKLNKISCSSICTINLFFVFLYFEYISNIVILLHDYITLFYQKGNALLHNLILAMLTQLLGCALQQLRIT